MPIHTSGAAEQLNFWLDLRWNRRGNQVVAQYLADQLTSNVGCMDKCGWKSLVYRG